MPTSKLRNFQGYTRIPGEPQEIDRLPVGTEIVAVFDDTASPAAAYPETGRYTVTGAIRARDMDGERLRWIGTNLLTYGEDSLRRVVVDLAEVWVPEERHG